MVKKRSGIVVMGRLVGLVKPLTGFMVLAVLMGLAGHLCASSITILGGYAVLELLGFETQVPIMESRAATILLPSSFWPLSETKYSGPCGGWLQPNWRGGTRETSSQSSHRISSC